MFFGDSSYWLTTLNLKKDNVLVRLDLHPEKGKDGMDKQKPQHEHNHNPPDETSKSIIH